MISASLKSLKPITYSLIIYHPVQMQLNAIQFEKLAGYFVDLAKVWFASGVIGFFVSNTSKITFFTALGGAGISAIFLIIGLLLLKNK